MNESLQEIANEWMKEEYSDLTDVISNWQEFDSQNNITHNFIQGFLFCKKIYNI